VSVVPAVRLRPPGVVACTRGVSLVEVLVSITLLAVAMTALPQLFAVASRATLDAGYMTIATVLAAQKIEELRSGPFPGPSAGGFELLDSAGTDVGTSGSPPLLIRRWWITPLQRAPEATVVIGVAVSHYRHARLEQSDAMAAESARVVTLWTQRHHDD
jgi:prepilin-type N-terminal cleavage/methylation domain-containing protein